MFDAEFGCHRGPNRPKFDAQQARNTPQPFATQLANVGLLAHKVQKARRLLVSTLLQPSFGKEYDLKNETDMQERCYFFKPKNNCFCNLCTGHASCVIDDS